MHAAARTNAPRRTVEQFRLSSCVRRYAPEEHDLAITKAAPGFMKALRIPGLGEYELE